MTDAAAKPRSIGSYTRQVRSNWAWFVLLGAGFLVAGGIAGLNLVTATLVSILYIGVMMLVGAGMTIAHAFSVEGWRLKLLHALAAIVYAIAGAIVLYDPILASFSLSLTMGILMCAAGGLRVGLGLRARDKEGWGWVVAAGVFTALTGILVILAWPGISLWLLGAFLTVDLIFQGCGYIAFGLSLRSSGRRRAPPQASPEAAPSAAAPPL